MMSLIANRTQEMSTARYRRRAQGARARPPARIPTSHRPTRCKSCAGSLGPSGRSTGNTGSAATQGSYSTLAQALRPEARAHDGESVPLALEARVGGWHRGARDIAAEHGKRARREAGAHNCTQKLHAGGEQVGNGYPTRSLSGWPSDFALRLWMMWTRWWRT